MFTMCSLFFLFFTVTGINNTMYSKYMIGNTKLNSKLPIVIFQINSISLIESENLGKPRIALLQYWNHQSMPCWWFYLVKVSCLAVQTRVPVL